MRTQRSRPRPRIQKKSKPRPRTALLRTDPLKAKAGMLGAKAKDHGHRRKCVGVLQKNVFQNFLQAISKRRKQKSSSQIFCKVSIIFQKILIIQKIVLSSSRGQGNFQGLKASRQKTSPWRPRTTKCVLEAKDVSKTPPLLLGFSVQTVAGLTVYMCQLPITCIPGYSLTVK